MHILMWSGAYPSNVHVPTNLHHRNDYCTKELIICEKCIIDIKKGIISYYKLNELLGGHLGTFWVAHRSCQYLYDNSTQAEYVKFIWDYIPFYVFRWHVPTAWQAICDITDTVRLMKTELLGYMEFQFTNEQLGLHCSHETLHDRSVFVHLHIALTGRSPWASAQTSHPATHWMALDPNDK